MLFSPGAYSRREDGVGADDDASADVAAVSVLVVAPDGHQEGQLTVGDIVAPDDGLGGPGEEH